MAIATRRARGAGDANGLRTSIERRRIVNAKFTARRQRMWEDARLQREEEEKRAAMEILERRKRERARLSSYIYATIQSHPKCLTKSRSEGSLSYSAESSQKSAGFKQKGYFSGGSVRNSRLGSAASKFDQIGVQEKESEQTQIGTSSTFPVIKQKSGKMRGSAGVSSMWSRSTTEAVQNRTPLLQRETVFKNELALREPSVTEYTSRCGGSTWSNTQSLSSWKNEPAHSLDLCKSKNSLSTYEQAVIRTTPEKQEHTLGFTSPITVLATPSEASCGSSPSLSVTTDSDEETTSSATQLTANYNMDTFLEGALQERLENENSTSLLIAELTGLKDRLEDCRFRSLVDNSNSALLTDVCQVSQCKKSLDINPKVLAPSVSGSTSENRKRAVYENALKSSKLAALNLKQGLVVSRNFGDENLKVTREEILMKNEQGANAVDGSLQCTDVLEDASSSMKGASSHDMMWKSNEEAVLCQTIENMNDNTMLWNVEAFSPIAVKNAKAHMPLGKNNDMLNYATMIGNREGQINYSFSSKDCKDTNLDGGLCFPNEHNEIFSMDAGMIIKSPSRSTLSSRKKCSTSFLSSESSQSKKSVQLPPLKHISNLSYRKDKKLILQSLRNRQKKNLLNISEKERSLLASIERLDVKLATTSLKGDTKSISMISDENSVKSAPTVMEQLNSCQGNRPRKILRHPLRPLSSLSAALPMKRRQNVGLTNKSKDNTNCCNHSNESKESEDSFPDSPLEVVQPTVGTIHIHQDPRFLLSP